MKSKISIFFISSFVCVAFWSHAAVHENFKERSGSYIQEVAHKAEYLSKYRQENRLSSLRDLDKRLRKKRKKHIGRVRKTRGELLEKDNIKPHSEGVTLDVQNRDSEQVSRANSWKEFIEDNNIFEKQASLGGKTIIQYIVDQDSSELFQLLFEFVKSKGPEFERAVQTRIETYVESLRNA